MAEAEKKLDSQQTLQALSLAGQYLRQAVRVLKRTQAEDPNFNGAVCAVRRSTSEALADCKRAIGTVVLADAEPPDEEQD
jgi:hypothetical protein